MHAHLDGIRKSAILLLSLPQEQREQILSRLPRDTADLVGLELSRLDEIPEPERQAVLRECCRELDSPGSPAPAVVSAEQLYDALREEHPQCVSAVLSCIPADASAGCLAKFPTSIQIEIIRRLARQQNCAPGMLEEIRKVLSERASQKPSTTPETTLLSRVLDDGAYHQDELFEPLACDKSAFRLEDLLRLDDPHARLVLLEIETHDLALALHSASRKLRAKIMRNLPQPVLRSLRAASDSNAAPSYLQEVESAHARIAQVLHRLEAAGDITLKRPRRRR